MRVLTLVTLGSIMAGLFGGELLDTIGVPGIWFPFGIGVSRTQYVYEIAIPLLALLIVSGNRTTRKAIELSGTTDEPVPEIVPDTPPNPRSERSFTFMAFTRF